MSVEQKYRTNVSDKSIPEDCPLYTIFWRQMGLYIILQFLTTHNMLFFKNRMAQMWKCNFEITILLEARVGLDLFGFIREVC